MSAAPHLRRTPRTHERPTGRVLKASPDYSVQSVLTWPGEDASGDIVVPDGLDFTSHEQDPFVDLEHGRHPDVGRTPVGWARKSLHRPGSPYAVSWGLFDVGGGRQARLPIGTTHFDPADRLQSQVYRMIAEGALPGVSLEFVPDWSVAKAIGWSELERRRAYRYPTADVHRWTICARAVCPNAQSVVKSQPLPAGEQVPPLLLTILSSDTVGSERLHPTIRKALAHHLPARQYHPVGKAMNDTVYDEAAPDAAAPEDVAPDAAADDTGPASNGVAALYQHAQALESAADDLLADIEATDNPQLYAEALRAVEATKAAAEKVKSCADKHDAKIQAAKGKTSDAEPDADADEPEEPSETEADMSKDEDGAFKAVRGPYVPILKAQMATRKLSKSEVQKALAAARAEEERAERAAEAELEREIKLTKKARRYAA